MENLYKANPIYKTIDLFCAVRGISIGAMCKLAKISPGLVTDLKMGRKQSIQIETAAKIATALGTDVTTFMNNEYSRGIWDVETCMKWFDADSDSDQRYLLSKYGVDLNFFLNKAYPERKKRLAALVFDQTDDQKEKSPTPEGVELLDEPNKKALIEYVLKKNFTDGQAKAVLSFIKQYEGGD